MLIIIHRKKTHKRINKNIPKNIDLNLMAYQYFDSIDLCYWKL